MIINVANILKALSRFKRTILPFTILVVVSVSLSAPTIYAASDDPAFSMKIGPLLRKTIKESNITPVDKQKAIKVPLDNQTAGQLHKAIVVINRDHLKPLPPELIEELRQRVTALGGHIGNHAYNNVQVWIPLDKIENLIEWTEIIRIDEPLVPQTNSIISEGTDLIGATSANNRGLEGRGIKVGVVDIGFKGYASLLGTELPASVTTKVMGTDADFTKSIHGAACAEIVHDVAPEAELFLVNVLDIDVDFHNAVSWLQSQSVNVISSSIGINLKVYVELVYLSLNGTPEYALSTLQNIERIKGQWDSTINSVVSDGVTWSQAAGNDGQKKWIGSFVDIDGDYYLNFPSTKNYNKISVQGAEKGDEIYVLLMWGSDTGFSTYDDFDLYISDGDGKVVCSSTIKQKSFPLGVEACMFIVDPAKTYYAFVYQWLTQVNPPKLILLLGHDKFPAFQNWTPSGTVMLNSPAPNPNVMTVGAVRYNTPNIIEPYSSQGPNADGVIKPDLVAPDCVSTTSYGSSPFCGTSAAAPHVAGISALVKQAYPAWSPSQIKSYLEAKAKGLGATGKDNVFGSGLVQLPSDLMAQADSMPLTVGWNFISFPSLPTSATVAAVFADVSSNTRIIWGYNNSAKEWRKYKRGSADNALSTIESGKGYWAYMDTSGNIDISGWDIQSRTVPLSEGWNLTGYNGTDSKTFDSSYISSSGLADKWVVIWTWENGQWYAKHATVTELPVLPLSIMNQGKAYWIKIKPGQSADWNQ